MNKDTDKSVSFFNICLYNYSNMKKQIKIIFVDIDWTILDHDIHDFDHESLDALKKAQSNGVLVYLCTARPYESILQIKLLDIFTPDGIICTNGGVIFSNDKLIKQNVIPNEITAKTMQICNKYHLEVEYGTARERYFSIPSNKYVTRYFSTFNENPCPVKKYEGEEVTSLLLMCPKRFDRRLLRKLPKELDYFRFDNYGVDIRYERNDKGKAIAFVLDYHNLSKDNALSLGDDFQDIFMFKATKYSAYIGEGKEHVLKEASYVSRPIREHGVKLTLEHFEII